MPRVTAFIDAMRDAFGRQEINQILRDAMAGEPGFWASENGREIGRRQPDDGLTVVTASAPAYTGEFTASKARR